MVTRRGSSSAIPCVMGLDVVPALLYIILPAGISFYTFQALSYTVDVYRGEMHARRNVIDFALFVAFFPHLVAGPIMRAQNLLSPADSTPDERMLGLYLVAMTATWAVPLFVDDLWARARERQPRLADWMVDRATRPGFVGAQLAGAGALVTLILVLRSHVSLDFIYFQF